MSPSITHCHREAAALQRGVNILLMAASVCSVFIIAHASRACALYHQQGKQRGVSLPTPHPYANRDHRQLRPPPRRQEHRKGPTSPAAGQTGRSRHVQVGHWPGRDELCNLPLRGFSISSCSALPIRSLQDKSLFSANPAQPFPLMSGLGITPTHLSPSCMQPTSHQITRQPPC